MSTDERKNSARHEAVHGSLAWFLGAQINSISITGPVKEGCHEDEDSFCYCDVQAPAMIPLQRLTEEDVVLRMVVALGPCGFEKARGETPSYGSHRDIAKFMEFLTWGRGNGTRIGEITRASESIIAENPDDLEKQGAIFFEQFGEFTDDLLREPRMSEAVDALANELILRGKLTGFESVCVLERAWGNPLPERAQPAAEHYCPPVGYNRESALESSLRLLRMILQILSEGDITGEDVGLERGREIILESIFLLSEIFAGGVHTGVPIESLSSETLARARQSKES